MFIRKFASIICISQPLDPDIRMEFATQCWGDNFNREFARSWKSH